MIGSSGVPASGDPYSYSTGYPAAHQVRPTPPDHAGRQPATTPDQSYITSVYVFLKNGLRKRGAGGVGRETVLLMVGPDRLVAEVDPGAMFFRSPKSDDAAPPMVRGRTFRRTPLLDGDLQLPLFSPQ